MASIGKTLTEKILSRATGKGKLEPGEILGVKVDLVMIHDLTGAPTVKLLGELGVEKVWNPERVVVVLDHQSPPASISAAENQKLLREFVEKQRIKNFYDIGTGICHQVVVEEGYACSGMIIVGADSHTVTYGALGAFSTGMGHTDVAAILATGETWMMIPETMKIVVKGETPRHLTSKDIILHIIGSLGADSALYKSIEFTGEAIKQMSISSRMTITNMSVEMGAKAGLVEPDEKTYQFLNGKARFQVERVKADGNADYSEVYEFKIDGLEPQVALPHTVDNVKPVSEVEGVEVNQAFLGSCTNGRFEDLKAAYQIIKGRKIKRGVRFIVSPASRKVYLKSLKAGIIGGLLNAGATITNPGCTACIGGHIGLLAPGEIAISSSNRNFKGRMGSPEAKVYLASPLTVAASAVKGEITDPRRYLK